MSYFVKFKGYFEYPDAQKAENALLVIDDEDKNPDHSEMNILSKEDFKLDSDKAKLTIDFSGSIPASTWYGCQRVICKMSKHATKGKIKCSFEGDPDEWVKAGRGWD